jgi:hypothetical protein
MIWLVVALLFLAIGQICLLIDQAALHKRCTEFLGKESKSFWASVSVINKLRDENETLRKGNNV